MASRATSTLYFDEKLFSSLYHQDSRTFIKVHMAGKRLLPPVKFARC